MISEGRWAGNKYKLAFWVLLAACAVVLVPMGCSYLGGRLLFERQEFARTTSPDGTIDAVLVKVTGPEGATGRSSLDLFLVPAGEDVEGLPVSERSLTADDLSDLDNLALSWRDEKLLEIRYNEASLSAFENYKRLRDEQGTRYVELRLIASEDRTAFSDGFFENRRTE